MLARYEKAKIDAEKSLNLIGIPFSKEIRPSGVVAFEIINNLAAKLHKSIYFTVLPSVAASKVDLLVPSFELGGIPFFPWDTQKNGTWLDDIGAEEILILLSESGRPPILSSEIKAGGLWQKLRQFAHVDPYQPFRKIGLDGKSLSLFYSSSHQDLELFFSPRMNKDVVQALKALGVDGLPDNANDL